MTESSPDRSVMFQGSNLGVFRLAHTLSYYDGLCHFICQDQNEKPWVAVTLADDLVQKTTDYLLAPITEEEMTAHLSSDDIQTAIAHTIRAMDREVHRLTHCWASDRVIAEKRISATENEGRISNRRRSSAGWLKTDRVEHSGNRPGRQA